MSTPNRLQDNWKKLRPLILQEWNLLNEADLEWIDFQFDRLVEVIRQRYGGRVEIVQEAYIRDRLNDFFTEVES